MFLLRSLTFAAVIGFAFASGDVDEVLRSIRGIDDYREKTIHNVISSKKTDFGWGYVTPAALTALQLANSNWTTETYENRLSSKQLEIELLAELLRNDSLRSGRLGSYVIGLLSTCRDPASFHGINLIDRLRSMPIYNSFELAYVSLALCLSGARPSDANINELVFYMKNYTVADQYRRDYLAIMVLASKCILKENPVDKLKDETERVINDLKSVQNSDGSFGNIDTSAIVIEALISSDDKGWNATAALNYLLNQQRSDGSFGNLMTTISILPILYAKNYDDVSNIRCSEKKANDSISTEKPSGDTIRITYAIWIETEPTQKYSINLTLQNTSFYQIMSIAAKTDKRYRFTAAESSFGHYVQSINGVKEDVKNNVYWMLGVLYGDDETPTLLDKGVDDYYPKNGDHVVFQYKCISA